MLKILTLSFCTVKPRWSWHIHTHTHTHKTTVNPKPLKTPNQKLIATTIRNPKPKSNFQSNPKPHLATNLWNLGHSEPNPNANLWNLWNQTQTSPCNGSFFFENTTLTNYTTLEKSKPTQTHEKSTKEQRNQNNPYPWEINQKNTQRSKPSHSLHSFTSTNKHGHKPRRIAIAKPMAKQP